MSLSSFSNADLIEELRSRNLAVKVWNSADVASYLKDSEHTYTDEEVDQIAEQAVHTSAFDLLEDCTDQDWEQISQAMHAAAEELDLHNKF